MIFNLLYKVYWIDKIRTSRNHWRQECRSLVESKHVIIGINMDNSQKDNVEWEKQVAHWNIQCDYIYEYT